jgi:hypothetical protein
MTVTARFDEYVKLLADIGYSGVTTEQNSGYINIKNYRKVAIVIKAIAVGTTLDADIELTTDGVSAGLKTLKSITQLGGSDDDNVVLININAEELAKPASATSDQYDWINVETTPSGSCTYTVLVFGLDSRFEPVASTEWDEVVA